MLHRLTIDISIINANRNPPSGFFAKKTGGAKGDDN